MSRTGDNEASSYESETRQLARGGGLLFVGQIAYRLLLAGGMALMANLLGATQFGLFALARSTVRVLQPLLALGLPGGVVRYIAIYDAEGRPDKVKGTVRLSVMLVTLTGCAAAVLLWFVAPRAAQQLFHKPDLAEPLRIMSIAIPFVILGQVLGQCTIGRKRAGSYTASLVSFAAALPLCFLLIYYLVDAAAVEAVVSFIVATAAAAAVAAWGVMVLFPELRDPGIPATSPIGPVLAFSAPLMLTDLSNLGLYQVNAFLAGIWVDSDLVGAYTMVSYIAFFGTVGLVAVRAIFRPTIAHLYSQAKTSQLKDLFRTTTRWGALLGLPMLAFIAIEADTILRIVGDEYVMAAWPLRILCIGQAVNIMTGPVSQILTMTGHQWQDLANTVVMAIANITLCVVLTPAYLITGTALAAGIAVGAANIARLGQVWYHVRIWPYDISIVKPLLSTLVAVGVLLLFHAQGLLWLAVKLAVFSAVVLAVYVALGLEKDDSMVLAALRRRLWPGESLTTDQPPDSP
jgi:O-antigen/teichoic acid export membrane protein